MRVSPLVVLALVACSSAPQPSLDVRTAAAVTPRDSTTPARVREVLSVIAADSMEGRAVWSAGSNRAAKYIAQQMAAAGLVPGGDSGYFQRIAGAQRTVIRPRRVVKTDSTGRRYQE